MPTVEEFALKLLAMSSGEPRTKDLRRFVVELARESSPSSARAILDIVAAHAHNQVDMLVEDLLPDVVATSAAVVGHKGAAPSASTGLPIGVTREMVESLRARHLAGVSLKELGKEVGIDRRYMADIIRRVGP